MGSIRHLNVFLSLLVSLHNHCGSHVQEMVKVHENSTFQWNDPKSFSNIVLYVIKYLMIELPSAVLFCRDCV